MSARIHTTSRKVYMGKLELHLVVLFLILTSFLCYVAAQTGGEFGGEWLHICVWLGPFCVHLKLSQSKSYLVLGKLPPPHYGIWSKNPKELHI